ncbi:MAG: choline kinase [Candidatus Nitrosomirales archaeon]|jgi:choline kinase
MPSPKLAIILAAGMGSRLGEYSKHLPKTLLTVGNSTIFDRMVVGLSMIGIKDIVVITGHAASTLETHALSYSSKLVNNNVNFHFIRNNNLDIGNIYSFWLARGRMNEDFILLNSDVVFDYGILNLLKNDIHSSSLVIDDSKTLGEEEMKVNVTEGEIIKEISKKLDPISADGEYIGIMKLSSGDATKVIEQVERLMSEKQFPLYYEDALRRIANNNDFLVACSTKGLPWTEIDTVEDMQYAQTIILPQLQSPA